MIEEQLPALWDEFSDACRDDRIKKKSRQRKVFMFLENQFEEIANKNQQKMYMVEII